MANNPVLNFSASTKQFWVHCIRGADIDQQVHRGTPAQHDVHAPQVQQAPDRGRHCLSCWNEPYLFQVNVADLLELSGAVVCLPGVLLGWPWHVYPTIWYHFGLFICVLTTRHVCPDSILFTLVVWPLCQTVVLTIMVNGDEHVQDGCWRRHGYHGQSH